MSSFLIFINILARFFYYFVSLGISFIEKKRLCILSWLVILHGVYVLWLYLWLLTFVNILFLFYCIQRVKSINILFICLLLLHRMCLYFSLGISSLLWTFYYLHIPIKSSIQKISSTNFDCTFDQTEPYLFFLGSSFYFSCFTSVCCVFLDIFLPIECCWQGKMIKIFKSMCLSIHHEFIKEFRVCCSMNNTTELK